MNPESAIESGAILKGTAITSGATIPPAYIITQASCGIDYTSPHILIPLAVSLLTGVWVALNIYEKIKNK